MNRSTTRPEAAASLQMSSNFVNFGADGGKAVPHVRVTFSVDATRHGHRVEFNLQ